MQSLVDMIRVKKAGMKLDMTACNQDVEANDKVSHNNNILSAIFGIERNRICVWKGTPSIQYYTEDGLQEEQMGGYGTSEILARALILREVEYNSIGRNIAFFHSLYY